MRLILSLGLTFLSTSAFAAEIDFATPLNGSDGKSIPECVRLTPDKTKCEEEITLTLGWLSRFSLDMPEEKIPLSDIIRRGNLSEKIKTNPKLDLAVDEAKLLKDQIVKLNYRVNIKYQAIKLIDPKGVEDAK